MKIRNEMMGDKVGKVGEETSGEMGDDKLRRARPARYEMGDARWVGVPRETGSRNYINKGRDILGRCHASDPNGEIVRRAR